MVRSRPVQFPLKWLLLALSAVAVLLSQGLSFWFLLVATEIIAIYMSVEVLARGMPAKLLSASSDNCYRLDGSRSERRATRELNAVRKVRTDLWGLFLILALVGTSAVVVVDLWVFPQALVPDIVAAALDDSQDFKTALQSRHVDQGFFRWSRNSSRNTNNEIRQHQELLRAAWPGIVGLAIVGCVAGVWLFRFGYFKTLHEFQLGVAARSEEYLNVDARRLRR